ncbi:MAG: hypothetical protein K6F52_03870 [Clostridia bacterium]|nr:hypothetical protein [Clostridia bacterium]
MQKEAAVSGTGKAKLLSQSSKRKIRAEQARMGVFSHGNITVPQKAENRGADDSYSKIKGRRREKTA